MAIDNGGGILGCAIIEGDKCFDIKIMNNIVAGAVFTSFAAYAHECNDYSTIVFKNNVAHSSDRTGAIIFRNTSSTTQPECMEASYFAAYKCGEDGIIGYSAVGKKLVFSNMVLIDNAYSGTVMIG